MSRKTAGEVLQAIEELCKNIEYTEEELDQELREQGIDPEKLVAEVMQTVRKYVKKEGK